MAGGREEVERLDRARGRDRSHAPRPRLALDDVAVDGVVVHDEDPDVLERPDPPLVTVGAAVASLDAVVRRFQARRIEAEVVGRNEHSRTLHTGLTGRLGGTH